MIAPRCFPPPYLSANSSVAVSLYCEGESARFFGRVATFATLPQTHTATRVQPEMRVVALAIDGPLASGESVVVAAFSGRIDHSRFINSIGLWSRSMVRFSLV